MKRGGGAPLHCLANSEAPRSLDFHAIDDGVVMSNDDSSRNEFCNSIQETRGADQKTPSSSFTVSARCEPRTFTNDSARRIASDAESWGYHIATLVW